MYFVGNSFNLFVNYGVAEWLTLINFIGTGLVIVMLNEKQRHAKKLADSTIETLNENQQALIEQRQVLIAQQNLLEEKQAEVEALNTRLRRGMQETHHRVKNNLQVIAALADIQSDHEHATVPAAALTRISTHVQSLATIHDLLTQEAKVSLEANMLHAKTILDRLIPLVQATTGGRRIHYTADDLQISSRQGAALALLVNELVSNAIKHGKGDINVRFHVDAETAFLEVCDAGPGFPANFDSRRAANTGLELIDSIGRWDLGGTVQFDNQPQGGARSLVTFPLHQYPEEQSSAA